MITIKDDIDKYVAVYYSDPKPEYFWGKIKKTFSSDPDSPNTSVEIDFLRKSTLSANPSDWKWSEKPDFKKEIEVIETRFLLYGPVLPDNIKAGALTFPDLQAMEALQKFVERCT